MRRAHRDVDREDRGHQAQRHALERGGLSHADLPRSVKVRLRHVERGRLLETASGAENDDQRAHAFAAAGDVEPREQVRGGVQAKADAVVGVRLERQRRRSSDATVPAS